MGYGSLVTWFLTACHGGVTWFVVVTREVSGEKLSFQATVFIILSDV